MKKLFIVLVSVLILNACSVTKKERSGYEKMSCAQLSKQISEFKEQQDKARFDLTVALLQQIASEKKVDKSSAELDGAMAELDEDNAKEHLRVLRALKTKKKCGI